MFYNLVCWVTTWSYQQLLGYGLIVTSISLWLRIILLKKRRSGWSDATADYYPPEGISPGESLFFLTGKYDSQALSLDILHSVMRGTIVVESHTDGSYTLKIGYSTAEVHACDRTLLMGLFKDGNEVVLKTPSYLESRFSMMARTAFSSYVIGLKSKECVEKYYDYLDSDFIAQLLFLTTLLIDMGAFTLWHTREEGVFLWILAGSIMVGIWGKPQVLDYTPEGLVIKRKLESFKCFLQTASVRELRRLDSLGTEILSLYKRYLSYAFMFYVDDEWSSQCSRYQESSPNISSAEPSVEECYSSTKDLLAVMREVFQTGAG